MSPLALGVASLRRLYSSYRELFEDEEDELLPEEELDTTWFTELDELEDEDEVEEEEPPVSE